MSSYPLLKYLQMATNEDLVVYKQVDSDEEVMMLIEEEMYWMMMKSKIKLLN